MSSYEKALKAIAGAVERGPGTSEVDWISHLATTQAKFIRDVTPGLDICRSRQAEVAQWSGYPCAPLDGLGIEGELAIVLVSRALAAKR